MKNGKWGTQSEDNRDLRVVLFVSRNKDNKDVDEFTERRMSFLTREHWNSEYIMNKFQHFVNNGVPNEVCRMYYSVNARDNDKVYKELLHFLIDSPDFNLCSIQSKLAGIAAKKENALTKHWMFDFDIDDNKKVDEFCNDIIECDSEVVYEVHKTPHGYTVITSRGFDTRKLMEKWDTDVTLKRDDLLCVHWLINS